ncbi:S8 family peptidase [Mesorhizobium sp. BR1-1-7]|uniref:S8 family peptidase n=1 Tax=Mesorhizobium sp. BR1-1-7 TaxID=2876647 RepID=UPI001CC9C6F0|nr:S8 family peptidase [Mesorhizobium sp. BR1-1-7]MBZ9921681.1 S8 family peptidase [Mesorhizobium sp. BR1-1-7]
MPTRFTLPHIDISERHTSSPYTGEGAGRSNNVRIREEHAVKLKHELEAALAVIDQQRPADPRLPAPQGGYIEVELRRGSNPDILERRSLGLRPGAVKDRQAARFVGLFVPDDARDAFAAILEDYRSGPLTPKGQQPPHKDTIEPIEAFRRARLETLWTDDADALPLDPQHQMWWAIWVPRDRENELEEVAQRLGLRAGARDRRLKFPEVVVIPVFARRAEIELMMYATGVIVELRRATDNPTFFVDEVREEQHEWNEELAGRIGWPGLDVPAVCLFDTGVNRAHALIEPALAADDMHAVRRGWGPDDHDSHGTAMGGIALHGDLTIPLGDTEARVLTHRLESVKLLPPGRADPSDPNSYGAITQAAVALPEIQRPDRTRVFCMAVTNDGVTGAQPSTWSSALDQVASGTMPGDNENSPKRLVVVAIGNTEPVMEARRWLTNDAYPAQDPAQAWNALTIGGYTDLDRIEGQGYEDWTQLAEVGALSPHSRTSVAWGTRTPIKPELVMEAGNRALSPSGRDIITLDSLCVLSTGRDIGRAPLVPFQATSAATAQAARMAAQLTAAHPDYWPETIRALMVHSAEYTEFMRASFAAEPNLRNRYEIVRRFGYGVPDYDRAAASARDHLALIAQTEIQPYRLKGGRKFNECHYYNLPLPAAVIEELDNEPVDLKITLSYFVDPNPGFAANVDPLRYQSFGLRFDLRRKGESLANFKRRVNVAEREQPKQRAPRHPDDNRWLLGPDSVSAGSLHCDIWSGPAIDLLGRDVLCIKPVGGWWRDRARAEIVNQRTRYALVVTLKARRTTIDLYTPIELALRPDIQVGNQIAIER